MQKPKDAKARNTSQTLVTTEISYPFARAAGKNQSQTRCCPSKSPNSRLFSSATASVTPVNFEIIFITCSWNTTTPSVSLRISSRSSWIFGIGDNPWRTPKNGEIMSLFTGPGRNNEISITRSVKLFGENFPISSRCPGLSI